MSLDTRNQCCAVDEGWRVAFSVGPPHSQRTGGFSVWLYAGGGGETVSFQPVAWLVEGCVDNPLV